MRALLALDPHNQYLLYSRIPLPADTLPPAPNAQYRVLPAANDRIWTLWTLPRALRQDRPALIHVQYTAPPPLLTPCPIVTTVHDISFRLFPEWFPRKDRLLLNLTVPASMRRAACVITDSESSRQDILKTYRLPPERVRAILLGAPEGFAPDTPDQPSMQLMPSMQETDLHIAKERYGLEPPYFLAVGVLQPRKNLRLLVEAFGRAKQQATLPHRLAIAGKAGWGTEQESLRALAAAHGGQAAAEVLLFPGYVADDHLPALYRASTAFCYPSLYEGFGLPPLEAMACGVPVLASSAPAMPEVCGDAAWLLAPTDVSAWTDALIQVATDPATAHALAAKGPAQAARFSWATTAGQTLALYREIAIQ